MDQNIDEGSHNDDYLRLSPLQLVRVSVDADLRPVVGYLEQQEPCRVKIQARNGGPTKSQLASALLDAANVHGANVVVDKHSNKLWNLFRNQGWKSSRSWHFVCLLYTSDAADE